MAVECFGWRVRDGCGQQSNTKELQSVASNPNNAYLAQQSVLSKQCYNLYVYGHHEHAQRMMAEQALVESAGNTKALQDALSKCYQQMNFMAVQYAKLQS